MRLIVFLLAFLPSVVMAQWTDEQKTLAVVSAVALVIDYGQTRSIAVTEGLYERNPMLPRHPTIQQVNRHFVLAPLVAYLVLDNISSEHRTTALRVLTIMQVGVVAHNVSIGIGVRF